MDDRFFEGPGKLSEHLVGLSWSEGFCFGILGERMNDGFEGPRISPAEVLLERPKRTQKAAGT